MFLKTYSTAFDETIIRFHDQNSRLLEIEDKVNVTLLFFYCYYCYRYWHLLINKNDTIFYRTKNKKIC